MEGLLNKGITEQGMAHRGYTKNGLRMWMANAKENMTKKYKTMTADRKAGSPNGVDGNTPRSKVY